MERTKDWGIFLLRAGIGSLFIAHGAQKLFVFGIPGVTGFMRQISVPFPLASAIALTAAEFLGGIAILAGFLTRWAAVPIAISMVVAAATVHLKEGFFLPGGAEYVLTLLVASLSLILTGSGALSIDRIIGRRRTSLREVQSAAPRPVGVR